jgi:osmotically-inducible protein OsmY
MSFWNHMSHSKRITFLSCFLGISLAVTGCNSNEPEYPAEQPLTDSELQSNIEAQLNSDPAVRAADLEVDTNASENRATISGSVATEALRMRAVDLAQSAHEGLTLDVQIDVEPPDVSREEWTEEYSRTASARAREAGDSVSDSLDDTWIHAKIVTKLIGDDDVAQRNINVDVEKNVVTLRGTLESREAVAEAVRIAKETPGVVRVVNQLKAS